MRKYPENNLRKIRKKNRLTLEKLAEMVDPPTSLDMISKLESGERELTHTWLQRLSVALGCSMGDIIEAAKDELRIAGEIRAGAVVSYYIANETADEILLPKSAGETRARYGLVVADNSNAPAFFKGYTYWPGERVAGGCNDFTDVYYVVKIKDGDTVVRRIRSGSVAGKYRLLSASDLSDDVEIEWHERVEAMFPPQS